MSDIISGLDSSSACTDPTTVTCLTQQGLRFIGRYYSRTTQIAGKKLTPAEAVLLTGGGMSIVAVYEDAPTEASYFSADRGRQDASTAMQQAAEVGQPRGSAIYFTVDYDASSADIHGVVTDYFKAVAETLGDAYRVGVYGSGATCTAIFGAGLAKLAWLAQSTGWSGYSIFSQWAIKQGPEMTLCGLNADSDVAHGDFGGFAVAQPSRRSS